MPPLPAAPSVLRVALSGTSNAASVWLSRFYIHFAGTAPSAAQLSTFDAAVSAGFNTNLAPLMVNNYTLTQIATQDLTSATGAVDVSAVSRVGSRAGTAFPAQVATVISYEIARRYRGGHPRGYWPFGAQGDTTNLRSWSNTYTAAVNTAFNAFLTAVFAAGWSGSGALTQVNVSYYSGFDVVTNPITHRARNVPRLRVAPTVDTVTSILTRPSIGTQRRREAFIA